MADTTGKLRSCDVLATLAGALKNTEYSDSHCSDDLSRKKEPDQHKFRQPVYSPPHALQESQ